MRKLWINLLISIFLIILILVKDKIYLLFDHNYFYPKTILNDYCQKNVNEYEIPSYEYKNVITRILYRDIYNFQKEITIYKGKNYNIKKNMAVIDKSGLVGIVNDVNKTTSKVMLLTNKKINLSVKVNNSYGSLVYKNNELIVNNLTNNEEIKEKDVVYTSGLGNLYYGIKIGEVIKNLSDDLETKYLIKPAADLHNLNYLMIIEDLK